MKTKPKIDIDLSMVESLAANGLTQEEIAHSIGISLSTLKNRKRESEEFSESIERGKAKGIAVVSNALMQQVKKGNVTAMIFYLKSRAGWRDTQSIEHSGINGNPINVNATIGLSESIERSLDELAGSAKAASDQEIVQG